MADTVPISRHQGTEEYSWMRHVQETPAAIGLVRNYLLSVDPVSQLRAATGQTAPLWLFALEWLVASSGPGRMDEMAHQLEKALNAEVTTPAGQRPPIIATGMGMTCGGLSMESADTTEEVLREIGYCRDFLPGLAGRACLGYYSPFFRVTDKATQSTVAHMIVGNQDGRCVLIGLCGEGGEVSPQCHAAAKALVARLSDIVSAVPNWSGLVPELDDAPRQAIRHWCLQPLGDGS